MAVISPRNLCALLDNIQAGQNFSTAMLNVGGGESAGWSWVRKSHAAEDAGETDDSTLFYFRWPSDGEKDYLHNHVVKARARRGAMLTSALFTGDVVIRDGKVAFEPDDFGGIALDDNGIPIPVRPTVRPVRIVLPAPQRELSPASFGTVSPARKAKIAVAKVPPPNALSDYIAANKKASSPLRKELEAKLAEARANPNRVTAKPNPSLAPVHILGRGGNNDPTERINQPSNQENMPTRMADAPRDSKKPAAIDYSRKARLDGA
jgi:hypothetical protein